MSGECWVDGDPSSPICIVGDGPTREDMENGRPFSSRTGHLLWSVLKWVGITRDECYILTVIGEWPEKTNGKPSAAQLVTWRPAFQANLAKFTGRIIVPLGPDALTEVTGLTGIDEWRGYIVAPSECLPYMISTTKPGVYKSNGKSKAGVVHAKGDVRTIKVRELQAPPLPPSVQSILPTLHPSVVLRLGRKPLPAFKADLERVSRVHSGNLRPRLEYEEYKERVPDIDPIEFVIDVETVPYLRVGLAGRDRVSGQPVAWTCPLNRDVRDRLRVRFDKGDGTFVAHNAQFDLAELRRNGFDWTGRIFDTMLAAYMLQPDLYKGLNEVASLYLDRGRWKHKADDDPVAYNLDDAKTEFELYEILKNDLAREGMLPLFESTMMPALRVLSAMTHRGIRVDGPRRDKWLSDLTVENNGLLDKWASLVGDVNPASPAQLQKLLFGRLKFNTKLAKNGKATTGKAELYELLSECAPLDTRRPILETLLSFRVNSKLLGTYARRPIDDDGCVHPYYLPVSKDSDNEDAGKKGAAGTGRIQARDPNIQQLPQSARRIIVPRADALILCSIDFKQLELRIAAVSSGDANLLRVLQAEDPFAEIMHSLKCDRTRAKNVAYGTIYGGGPPAICKALRTRGVFVEQTEAKRLQETFAARFPTLWNWRRKIVNEVSTTYRLTNPFHRKRYFWQGNRDGPAAIDFMCQSTAADIIWASLKPLEDEALARGGAQLATIHDEALFELPRVGLGESIQALRTIMEREWPEIGEGFSVPTEAKVGENWGEMEAWSESWNGSSLAVAA